MLVQICAKGLLTVLKMTMKVLKGCKNVNQIRFRMTTENDIQYYFTETMGD